MLAILMEEAAMMEKAAMMGTGAVDSPSQRASEGPERGALEESTPPNSLIVPFSQARGIVARTGIVA